LRIVMTLSQNNIARTERRRRMVDPHG